MGGKKQPGAKPATGSMPRSSGSPGVGTQPLSPFEQGLRHLEAARLSGAVKRCHALRLAAYTVAEHSYGVACLVTMMLAVEEKAPSSHLLMAALYHDCPEQLSGDTPGHGKVAVPGLRAATVEAERLFYEQYPQLYIQGLRDWERRVLKWADKLEFLFYCREQENLGNTYAPAAFDAGAAYLKALPKEMQDRTGQNILHYLEEAS